MYLISAEAFEELAYNQRKQYIDEAQPEDDSDYDPLEDTSMEWQPNEKPYFLFILGLLTLGVNSAAKILKERSTPTLRDKFRKIDVTFANNIWHNAPAADNYIGGFYDIGKGIAGKDLQVLKVYDRADRHALDFLKNYNFDQISNLSDDLRENIRQTIWEGVGEGKGIPQIAKELRANSITNPLTVINKTTGTTIRHVSAYSRSMMVARTETMRALNQGTLMTYAQHGITSINIQTAGDNKVCADCQANLLGNPYNINNVPYLPVHPLCRCRYTADPYSIPTPAPDTRAGNFTNPQDIVNTLLPYKEPTSYPNLVTDDDTDVLDIPEALRIPFENPMNQQGGQ